MSAGRTLLLAICTALASATLPTAAQAAPPTLSAVDQQQRHPTATFSAPRADDVTINLASKPDRATDGSFLSENVEALDLLSDSEIQSGRWVDEDQIDPGTYWVMLRASPDFGLCYLYDSGTYDPTCADGFSNVVQLLVPKPSIRYSVRVFTYRYLRQVSLTLTATPLGERQPYRLCFRAKNGRNRCLGGTLEGFSWNTAGNDSLTVSTGNLPTVTTFNWFVGGKRIASKRVRVR
jgi:hypothetical protein